MSGSDDAFHYSASVAHFHAGATPVTPLDLLQPGEARNDDYDDNLTLSTKLGLDVTPNFDLGLVARYTDIHLRDHRRGLPRGPPVRGYPGARADHRRTRASTSRASPRTPKSFDGLLDQTLGLAYTHDRTATVQPQTPSALNTGERRKADWQGDIKFVATETLVLGAEYERDEIDQPITADVHIGSGYGELQSQIGEHWFSALNVALRRQQSLRRQDDLALRAGVGDRRHRYEAQGVRRHRLQGADTLSELYQSFPPFSSSPIPTSSPRAAPATTPASSRGSVHDVLRVGVTYYYNRIRDLITTDVTGTTYANIGRATTDGIESFIAYQPLQRAHAAARLHVHAGQDDVLHAGAAAPSEAPGHFRWQPGRRHARGSGTSMCLGRHVGGRQPRLSVPRLDAPGYTTVNLATSYDLNAAPGAVRARRQPVRPSLRESGRLSAAEHRRLRRPQGEAVSTAEAERQLHGARVIL